jgi:GNAT superfamily N-acetyltransferase
MNEVRDKSKRKTAQRPARLTVRRARPSDLVPLGFFFDALLRRDYFLRRGQLQAMLASEHHEVYVAELDTILVGAAITTRGTQLVNTLVHPAYRRLGIGRALVEQSGAESVRAKLDMSAGDPRQFYEALGFEATGRRNGKGNIELLELRADRAKSPSAIGGAAGKTGSARAGTGRSKGA